MDPSSQPAKNTNLMAYICIQRTVRLQDSSSMYPTFKKSTSFGSIKSPLLLTWLEAQL